MQKKHLKKYLNLLRTNKITIKKRNMPKKKQIKE